MGARKIHSVKDNQCPTPFATMSVQFQSQNFQHILRMCNTNVDGRQKVMFALTAIRGIGRRFSNIICKKCDIDLEKRAGELSTDEINKLVAVISNPLQFKIPAWILNRQRDVKDGKTSQKYANFLDQSIREDLERMKRVRLHRGLRHYWGIRVRGQHTKTTGRHRAFGDSLGAPKKK